MERKHFYVLVNLTDEVVGIGQSEIPEDRDHSIVRKRYPSIPGFKFPIIMFRYRRCEIKSDWVVIFWIPQGTSISSNYFIKNITAASREAPAHLLRQHNSDAIA